MPKILLLYCLFLRRPAPIEANIFHCTKIARPPIVSTGVHLVALGRIDAATQVHQANDCARVADDGKKAPATGVMSPAEAIWSRAFAGSPDSAAKAANRPAPQRPVAGTGVTRVSRWRGHGGGTLARYTATESSSGIRRHCGPGHRIMTVLVRAPRQVRGRATLERVLPRPDVRH